MIYYTKARAVRIRIMSGGEEHSSFDSLMHHFSVNDLLDSAVDGRLSNWLLQQGKDAVAEGIVRIKDSLLEKPLQETTYLNFVSCFFEDISSENVTTQESLFDWWGKTVYNDAPEYKKLEIIVEASRLKAKKTADDIILCLLQSLKASRLKANKTADDKKMQMDYKFALDYYAQNKEARTNSEWTLIFEKHSSKAGDPDYNWLMYQVSNDKKFLEKAAKLGHTQAIAKMDRFAGINKPFFKLAFSKCEDLSTSFSIDNWKKRQLDKVLVKTDKDQLLKKEISNILEALDIYRSSSGQNISYISLLRENTLLRFESVFVLGLFSEGISGKCEEYYSEVQDDYVPAKARMKMKTRNEKCRLYSNSQSCPSWNMSSSLRENKDKIANIICFILKHLFDTYEIQ